jgi:transcription termination/antitermination protein NusG
MTNNETGSAYQPGRDAGDSDLARALGCRQSDLMEEPDSSERRPRGMSNVTPLNGHRVPAPEELSWFAVVTRSRHERKVHDQLRSRGVESFLPVVQRWSRWRDRRKLIEWPLFSGYCFARCSMYNLRPVLACRGVVHLVSFAARPAPVPDYEIDGIRQLLASRLPHDPCPFIDVGTWVQVVYGPLRGVRGRLVWKDTSTTLVVAIEMLGRALRVQIDAADVRPLETLSQASDAKPLEYRRC